MIKIICLDVFKTNFLNIWFYNVEEIRISNIIII